MIKRFVVCFGFIFLMLLLFLTLVSNAFPSQVVVNSVKTFTLTINSKQVIVILPDEFPDIKNAKFVGEECFNLNICRQEFCIPPLIRGHDHVDFVFTDKGEVIALVWIRTLEAVYVAWKYVNGIPILSSIDEIKTMIRDAEKPKEINHGIHFTLYRS